MIYNAKHHFLFIHIQKTAGTSLTRALAGLEGSHFIAPPHLRLQDIRLKTASRPYIFAVVRNPWDRLVSWYAMMCRKGGHNDFSRYLLWDGDVAGGSADFGTFIRRVGIVRETYISELADALLGTETAHLSISPNYLKSIGFNQLDYISDAAEVVCCDRVLRFERLQEDWIALCDELKLACDRQLPMENRNPAPKSWRDAYADAADRDWVGRLYARDIAHFGYRFDADHYHSGGAAS